VRDDQHGHDRARGRGASAVLAHKLVLVTRMEDDFLRVWREQYGPLSEILARHAIDGFVYHYGYEFGAANAALPWLLLTNLAMATATIALVCSAFLRLRTALLCALAVVCIDLIVVGTLALHGIPLHAFTAIALLISLGARARRGGGAPRARVARAALTRPRA
jgi:hypothetical protein